MGPPRSWQTCVRAYFQGNSFGLFLLHYPGKISCADPPCRFLVAYKWFIDNVPKAIDERLVLGAASGLQGALATGLRLDSHYAHERCAKLLAEPLRMAERRAKLVARQRRLSADCSVVFELEYTRVVS
jgi:hypothetical protein